MNSGKKLNGIGLNDNEAYRIAAVIYREQPTNALSKYIIMKLGIKEL